MRRLASAESKIMASRYYVLEYDCMILLLDDEEEKTTGFYLCYVMCTISALHDFPCRGICTGR